MHVLIFHGAIICKCVLITSTTNTISSTTTTNNNMLQIELYNT